jgi:hypothetical protein
MFPSAHQDLAEMYHYVRSRGPNLYIASDHHHVHRATKDRVSLDYADGLCGKAIAEDSFHSRFTGICSQRYLLS